MGGHVEKVVEALATSQTVGSEFRGDGTLL